MKKPSKKIKKQLKEKSKIEKQNVEVKASVQRDLEQEAREIFDVKEDKKDVLQEQIKDILDVIDSRTKKIDEINQINEILIFLNERLNSKRYSELTGEWLSRAALKLSILNINVGLKAAESSMRANMGYGYRKFEYASQWKVTKERIAHHFERVTNEDVKSELETVNWVNFKKEMEEKMFADKMLALNHGVDTLLVSIGYRLKMLTQERMTAKFQS